jgi:hypothetical protein
MMKRPNFFIVGAPKCGTTSLAHWLQEHPRVYIPLIKEPNFFNTDDRWFVVRTLQQYENLFSKAAEEHLAIGEASVWYLYSKVAVGNILNYNPDARFIVMIRNPIEMAVSLHQQELLSGNEHIRDFKKAWMLQSSRARGEALSPFCVEPKRLLYGPACKLGEQLTRLFEAAPRERVLVIVLDDVRMNPRQEWLRVLQFLELPDDKRYDFPVYNQARQYRSQFAGLLINLLYRAKRALGIHEGLGMLRAFRRLNSVSYQHPPLDSRVKNELADYFRDDVQLLSTLLERDLSHWVEVSHIGLSQE